MNRRFIAHALLAPSSVEGPASLLSRDAPEWSSTRRCARASASVPHRALLPSPSYSFAFCRVSVSASSCAAPSEPTETVGVCVSIRGLNSGAPDTIRTYDLGFRKQPDRGAWLSHTERKRFRFLACSRLGRSVRFAHFHVLAINAFDGAPQIVGVEICVALRGREVGMPGELLHCDGWCPVPEQLGHEEVP